MPDEVESDCGGTLDLDHPDQELTHSVEEHVDPYYVIGHITRRERF